jgi:hypothetical protein
MNGHELWRLPGKRGDFLRLESGLIEVLQFLGLIFGERSGVVGHSISELDKVVDINSPPSVYVRSRVAVGIDSSLDVRAISRHLIPLMSCVGPHHRPLQSVFCAIGIELEKFSKIIHLRDDHWLGIVERKRLDDSLGHSF